MPQPQLDVNTAALTTVMIGSNALETAIGRRGHLPGIVVFSGHSGLGKSVTAAYLMQLHSAYYVEVRRTWTRAAFLDSLLKHMGIPGAEKLTMPAKFEAAREQLLLSGRPLIIDEFDNIVDRSGSGEFVELIRDLADGSQGAVMIIGEERLPHKLTKWERFHNRVLGWYQAQPASIDDCRILAGFYYPWLTIGDQLHNLIHKKTHGITRRICINLDAVARDAADQGLTAIDLDSYKKPIYTGEPPKARAL